MSFQCLLLDFEDFGIDQSRWPFFACAPKCHWECRQKIPGFVENFGAALMMLLLTPHLAAPGDDPPEMMRTGPLLLVDNESLGVVDTKQRRSVGAKPRIRPCAMTQQPFALWNEFSQG